MTKLHSFLRSARTTALRNAKTTAAVVLTVIALDALLTGTILPANLFGLVESERLIRVYSPIYHHDLSPGQKITGAQWGALRYDFATNSLGFKDRSPRTVSLTADHPRILFIGDSFTEGNGFDFGQTFPGQVEALLANRGVEVLNAAVSSYSPAIYYRKVAHLLEDKHLEFDLAAVFIDISDIDDEARGVHFDPSGNVVSRDGDAAPGARAVLKRYSSIYRLISALNRQRKSKLTHVNDCLEAVSGPGGGASLDAPYFRAALNNPRSQWTWNEREYQEWGQRGLNLAAANMTRLKSLLDTHGIALIVAVYPWPEQIFERETGSRQVRFWRAWSQDNGANFLDLFPPFMAGADPLDTYRKYFVPCDVHWNAQGHRLVAEKFAALYRSLETPAGSLQ